MDLKLIKRLITFTAVSLLTAASAGTAGTVIYAQEQEMVTQGEVLNEENTTTSEAPVSEERSPSSGEAVELTPESSDSDKDAPVDVEQESPEAAQQSSDAFVKPSEPVVEDSKPKLYSGVGETKGNNKDTEKTPENIEPSVETKEEKEEEEDTSVPDGWNIINGAELYYKDNAPYTGWISEKGKWYYTYEGKKYTDWRQLGKKEGEKLTHWSYFGKDGVLRTGWVRLGKGTSEPDGNTKAHWSYFGDNGWLRTGWVQLGKGTSNPDGNAAAHWSYFGDNGWLRTDWVQLGKGTSNPDGNAAAHWSYFGDNGWLRTGWVQLGEGTSNPDGNAAAHWSYFGDNGWLRTGWVQLGKGTSNPDGNAAAHWSYFGDNGWLRTGWVKLGKGTSEPDGNSEVHWSYFGDNGWLTTGTRNISGMNCTFNDSGWLRRYETVTPHYRQHAYGYSTGCGGVSLFMAMRYKGYLSEWSLQQFMDTMPYTSDGNPNNGFVGSPYNYDLTPSNRGIYPSALAKWGARYGNVTDISGCSVDQMMKEVKNGNPVVALATWNLSDYAITRYSWGLYRDYNHHFFVLVGYDYNTDRYKVMDALVSTGDGSKWVTGSSFRKVWNGIKGAVLVK